MFSFEINVICDDPDCNDGHYRTITSELHETPDITAAIAAAMELGWTLDHVKPGEKIPRVLCPECSQKRRDQSERSRT